MEQRMMTAGQRAYEAKRAAKAGVSLEKWLVLKTKEAEAERVAAVRAAQAEKPAAAARKPGFFSRLLEKAQRPI